MTLMRYYLRDRRHFALAIIIFALLMRLLLPVGFMPDVSTGKIAIALCTGHGPTTIDIAVPGAAGHHDPDQTAKHDMPCPFASGSAQGLAGADPILLVIAIAFVMTLRLRPVAVSRIGEAPNLRPPLRGPPFAA